MGMDSGKMMVLANRLRMEAQRSWGERVALDLILHDRAGLIALLARAKADPRLSELALQIEREAGLDLAPGAKAPPPRPSAPAPAPMAAQADAPAEKEKGKEGEGDGKKGKKDPRAYLGGLR